MRAFAVTTAVLFGLATLPVLPAVAADGPPTAKTDAQKKEDREIDKAYRAAIRGEPATTAKVDPWGKVRPAESDKKPK
jgi:hypothetical protein